MKMEQMRRWWQGAWPGLIGLLLVGCELKPNPSLTRVEDPSAFGVVPTRANGEVIAFVEKPPREQAPTNWINAGTYVLEPSALASIPPRLNVSIERETFPRMLERPGRLFAMQSSCYWLDIGTPRKFYDAQIKQQCYAEVGQIRSQLGHAEAAIDACLPEVFHPPADLRGPGHAYLAGDGVGQLTEQVPSKRSRISLSTSVTSTEERLPVFRHTALYRGSNGASVEQLEDLARSGAGVPAQNSSSPI